MKVENDEIIQEAVSAVASSLKTQIALNYEPLTNTTNAILDKLTLINQTQSSPLLKLGNDLNDIYSELDNELHGINDIEKGIDKLETLVKELEGYIGFLENKIP